MEITRGKIEKAQKVVLYGVEGIGKSTFASHFPDALFIDTEGSTAHLDVARLPDPTSWQMLIDEVKHVRDNPDLCKTLVIDTADWAEKLCAGFICARGKKTGIEDFGYGKGYVYLAEEFGRLLNLLTEVIDRDIHVVLTAHAIMRKFEQPDEMGAYDRWELKLQRRTGPLVKEWADMILFANYKTIVVQSEGKPKAQGGKRVMYASHHPCWDAKNRQGLPDEMDFSFEAISHVFNKKESQPEKTVFDQDTYFRDTRTDEVWMAEKGMTILGDGDGRLENSKKISQREYNRTLDKIRTEELKKEGFTETKEEAPFIEGEKKEKKTSEEPPSEDESLQASFFNKDDDAFKSLEDLMELHKVTKEEMQGAVESKGYFPEGTPIENYPLDFIDGVLVGAWDQVHAMIKEIREIPF